ncbi:hypothetical protein PCC8801_2099 [Rippkaea orientalis PCC 8801]|uniref:Uncharacterized protein n=1 Tax=Rippkaea orientalis (strain PCC 8801 / RF-1) TaxID=41431 RepID=B7JZY4_RIPO1|nr:hypothetical protein [Rippkaea orientalis]ACK66131.1 hypothetical protein PCC8801_2099 [Rippkaea orientalis PCC 8801]
MGRKAKLKKVRKSQSDLSSFPQSNPNQFVNNIERQGYSLNRPERAPDVPQKRVDPQV